MSLFQENVITGQNHIINCLHLDLALIHQYPFTHAPLGSDVGKQMIKSKSRFLFRIKPVILKHDVSTTACPYYRAKLFT